MPPHLASTSALSGPRHGFEMLAEDFPELTPSTPVASSPLTALGAINIASTLPITALGADTVKIPGVNGHPFSRKETDELYVDVRQRVEAYDATIVAIKAAVRSTDYASPPNSPRCRIYGADGDDDDEDVDGPGTLESSSDEEIIGPDHDDDDDDDDDELQIRGSTLQIRSTLHSDPDSVQTCRLHCTPCTSELAGGAGSPSTAPTRIGGSTPCTSELAGGAESPRPFWGQGLPRRRAAQPHKDQFYLIEV